MRSSFGQLKAEPAEGPATHGWEDQRWTLGRVKTVIGRRFHLTYTIQGVRKLLVRDGRKSLSRRDYRDLLIAAHQQLDDPIVVVWDNLNVHKAAGLREFAPDSSMADSPGPGSPSAPDRLRRHEFNLSSRTPQFF
nr:winged helix-turn-helix domain-containing protein [Streptomyces sp. RKND-216]